jgi:hypothetical protein
MEMVNLFFLAFLCKVTRIVMPGSLILFLLCILFYYVGLFIIIFKAIPSKSIALVCFGTISFCPLLFANIGVIQTETMQLAFLSLFVSLTFMLYHVSGRLKLILFVFLLLLLTCFSVARYDTFPISTLLSYWLCYSFFKKQGYITLFWSLCLLLSFYFSAKALDKLAGNNNGLKSEMMNSLLVADIAAISSESNTNYVPDYCWQDYLSSDERTVAKIQYGMVRWNSAFYSFLFNIDPQVGLFTYNVQGHETDLRKRWVNAVLLHPYFYLKYHWNVFKQLLTNDYFNMGLWSGLKDSHVNHSRLEIERTAMVDSFLHNHTDRYTYENGCIVLFNDETAISQNEEDALLLLAGNRRAADVKWMKWYSQIPSKIYMVTNCRTERYVQPFMEWYKQKFRWLSCLFPYLILLVIQLFVFRKKVQDPYLKFTFTILCLCGIFHLGLRAIILTDPVFRFGMLSILFSFYTIILLIADKQNLKNCEGKISLYSNSNALFDRSGIDCIFFVFTFGISKTY